MTTHHNAHTHTSPPPTGLLCSKSINFCSVTKIIALIVATNRSLGLKPSVTTLQQTAADLDEATAPILRAQKDLQQEFRATASTSGGQKGLMVVLTVVVILQRLMVLELVQGWMVKDAQLLMQE